MNKVCAPILFPLIGILALAGCAHAPVTRGMDPEQVFAAACEPGRDVESVAGGVWLKAKSKDASGQFPAQVQVKAPQSLKLEVTNLIGGTEAFISIENSKYEIRIPSKKGQPRVEEGSDSWGGIPLRWATDLFLGKIPCPAAAVVKGAKLSVNQEGALVVETAGERYTYGFRNWEARPWPETLKWESLGKNPTTVDFKFDDPESRVRSPRKWEAVSSRGEVKVRWQDRNEKLKSP